MSCEFTHYLVSANETDSSLIEEKIIMFFHFFPNKENANERFVYLGRSQQNITALGENAAECYSEHKSTQKRDNRKLTTNK